MATESLAVSTTPQPCVDQHFATQHLMADLKGRSVRGGAITLGAQGFRFVLQLGATIVLARLLTPADFGLIAMVTVFTTFVGMFKDLGLSTATVQRAEITHEQVSTLFWINVGLSVLLSAVGIALAPLVAGFYGEPRLVSVTIAISATFIFGGLAAQHMALLRRQMKFHLLAISDIASLAIGIAAAIILAWLGTAFWALVGMIALQAAATAAFAWIFSGWRPGWARRRCGARSMVAFGSSVACARLCNFVLRNADNLLLGWAWGPIVVGLYSKAYQLLMLPITQANAPLSNVVMPSLSRLQNQPERFRHYYKQGVLIVTSVSIPLSALMFLLAEPIVLVLLGPQWTPAIPIFKILAIASFVEAINVTHAWLFVPFGQSSRLLRCAIVRTIVSIIAFVIGLPWGATGVAIAFVISRYVIRLPELWYASRGTPVRMSDALVPIVRPLLCAMAGLALVATIDLLGIEFTSSNALPLFRAALFGFAYTVCWMLWAPHRELLARLEPIARLAFAETGFGRVKEI